MFPHVLLPLLWAQAPAAAAAAAPAAAAAAKAPQVAQWAANLIYWAIALGDPTQSIPGYFGAILTYLKIVGLFSLVGWVGGWVLAAFKDRNAPRAKWLDIAAAVSVLGIIAAVSVGVLQQTKLLPEFNFKGINRSTLVAMPFVISILLWVERSLWQTISRKGEKSDLLVLGGIHMALIVGVVVAYLYIYNFGGGARPNAQNVVVGGAQLGATYMGLVVLMKVLALVLVEVLAIRPRRIFAIAKLTVVEATRRMWAPWIVLIVFAVVLAFTHWFLQAPDQRPAEIGRMYINTLTVLCSLLITVMVAVLSPISLPQDIQNQTIYTIVSKPVRRIELIWGRLVGFMSLVTFLMVLFGLFSLKYLERNVRLTILETEATAKKLASTDPTRSKQLFEQADQLRTNMSARLPVKGVLTFTDSKGTSTLKGIDVGQELEYRSHVEGGTVATAIWTYGTVVPDPYGGPPLSRPIPVDQLLVPGTIEEIENRKHMLEYGVAAIKTGRIPAKDEASKAKLLTLAETDAASVARLTAESQKLQSAEAELLAKAEIAEKSGDAEKAEALRSDALRMHSPPLLMEMTFTIYRTTKGRVGEPVYAELEVSNPNPGVNQTPFRNIFPIREYYTNKQYVPASYIVGSNGSMLVKVRCVSPTQYLGMAESDLYILQDSGNFGVNFWLGLGGIWLQAMVLTAIGVFAGTFLSWPMALLTTIAFFIAGQVAFQLFQAIQLQGLIGGGPFESLIRLFTHDNQMSELTPTLSVVVAKTLDGLTMPVLTRLAYIVPNFQALDVTQMVAEGFAVPSILMINNVLLAVAYALPFTIGGYFILKNREVAA
jgi:hypothetical protein